MPVLLSLPIETNYTGTGTARAAEVMVGSTSESGVLVAVDLKLLAQDEAIATSSEGAL